MDAAELLSSDQLFVADTSAWWRVPMLPARLRGLVQEAIREDRVLITPVARMEILYSARTAEEYTDLDARLSALRLLRNDRAAADAAMTALRELAGRADGYHRVPVTDALIAAAAADQGGLAVLHRDGHFDRLAEVMVFESVAMPVD
ncbi:MAG: PIN domain-containing protein [Solirubrobacteraceae bacterium]